jgi:hypothetical protein
MFLQVRVVLREFGRNLPNDFSKTLWMSHVISKLHS